MKKLIKLLLLSLVLCTVFGCATTDDKHNVCLRPPDTFNPVYLRYQELAGEKALFIAIDMDGNWAFGYDHEQSSLQTATENAAFKCNEARRKHKVYSEATLFAINDEIVYYKNQFK